MTPNWDGQFDNFEDWVIRGQRRLRPRASKCDSNVPAVCIDDNGKRCTCGYDFKHAKYPVRYFWDFQVAQQSPEATSE